MTPPLECLTGSSQKVCLESVFPTPSTHSPPPIPLVLKIPIFEISVNGAIILTTTHSRKGKSTTATLSFSYTAPRWETSAALQSGHRSVQLSPLHHSQQIIVTLASQNSQLCVLHSDCPLGSVCVLSPRAAACELCAGEKLGELGCLRAHLVSSLPQGITVLCDVMS